MGNLLCVLRFEYIKVAAEIKYIRAIISVICYNKKSRCCGTDLFPAHSLFVYAEHQ